MERGKRSNFKFYEDASLLKQDEVYEAKVDKLLSLIEQEAILGVLESTLDVLLDNREIFKSGDIIQDLIDYLQDDISYATEQ